MAASTIETRAHAIVQATERIARAREEVIEAKAELDLRVQELVEHMRNYNKTDRLA